MSSSISKFINYLYFFILIAVIGAHAFNFYRTRDESFSGVWIVRATLLILIVSFLASYITAIFFHPLKADQIPSCTDIAYFRLRWYFMLMAVVSLAAISVYFAIVQSAPKNHLTFLLASQIELNLLCVMLCIAMDSLTRYFFRKQSAQPQERPQSPIQQQAQPDPQFGYFSPKSKGNPPLASATSQKHPLDSGKFRYAR